MGINPIEALGEAPVEQPGESGQVLEEAPGGTPLAEEKPEVAQSDEILPPPGGEGETPTFYDASKVPAELQATFKEMQAGLTRKFQEVSRMKQDLQGAQEQAGLLKSLLADDEVVKALDAIRLRRQGVLPEGEEEEGAEVETAGPSDQRVRKLEQKLAELDSQRQQETMRAQIQQERDRFVARFPEWEKHRDWMAMAWKQDQSLSMVGAYHEAVAMEKDYRSSLQKKQVGVKTVEKPNTPATRTKPSSGKADSWYEAAEQAKADLGLDDRF